MLPGKTYKVEEFIQILRKRFWFVVVPWAIIAAGTAGFGRLLPDQYRSSASIQVVPPRVPDSIVRPSTASTLQERLKATEQVILSRTRLERLIKEFNLYEEEQKTQIMEDVANTFRKDILTQPVKGDMFKVTYTGRNPVTVMKVTEKLASFFIDESLKDGLRKAEGTSAFVDAQVEEKRRQLQELEDKLTKYKMQNAGELPTQVGVNQGALNGIQSQLSSLAQQMNFDQNRKMVVERNIADLESQSGSASVVVTQATDPSQLTGPASARLAQAKAGLDAVIAKGIKPTHMDYQKWERAVKLAQKDADAEALRKPVGIGVAVSPAEANRLRQLANAQDELDLLKRQIAQREAAEKQLRAKAGEYQAKVDRAPLRDAELIELTRESNTLQGIYQSYVAKRETASTSVDLERRQLGEQFTLIDSATLPQRPVSPDRLMINIIGLLAGLAAGLVLVVLLEYRDSSFKTDSDLAGLGLPVLAVVPLMQSDVERRAQFRKRLVLNLGLGGAVAVCGAVVAYSFVFLR